MFTALATFSPVSHNSGHILMRLNICPNNQFCVQEPFAAPAVPPPAAAEPAAAQQQKKIRRQSLSIRDVNLKSNDITLKT